MAWRMGEEFGFRTDSRGPGWTGRGGGGGGIFGVTAVRWEGGERVVSDRKGLNRESGRREA